MNQNRDLFYQQLPFTLNETHFPGLGERRQGKVRDTYRKGETLFIATSDRISAFDRVLGTVPFKGEILNRTTEYWFDQTKDVAKNHLVSMPDPNVLVCKACQPLPIECVVRGYLTGSLWRDYQSGKGAKAYGIDLPDGMKKDEKFARPILTPTTKAEVGHDEAISYRRIIDEGMVSQKTLDRAYEMTLAIFARGQALAAKQGLILVDTKYEFGLCDGELIVIDEIHTMDSSRFWEASEYETRFTKGDEQKMLDKENVRQWLIKERGYQGDGPAPELPPEVRVSTAEIYAYAYERITGRKFVPGVGDVTARIGTSLHECGYL